MTPRASAAHVGSRGALLAVRRPRRFPPSTRRAARNALMKNRIPRLVLASLPLAPALSAEGDVRAFLDRGGRLIVLGDAADNEVVVGRTGEPGEFRVVGEGTTTVNGTDEVVLSAESVRVLMRGGDDEARIDGNILGDVAVEGGAGNDVLSLGDPTIAGTAVLDGGPGDDHLGVEGTSVDGGLRLLGGPGDDEFHLFFAVVRERLVIEAGPGDDDVSIDDFFVDGFLRVDAAAGADVVRLLRSTVTLDVVLVLAAGSDEAVLEQDQLGAHLKIALGAQDDLLAISGTEVAKAAAFHGGPGTDVYDDPGDNDFLAGPPLVAGFEVFTRP